MLYPFTFVFTPKVLFFTGSGFRNECSEVALRLSFLEELNESHDLNRSWGVGYALPLQAQVAICWTKLIITDLETEMSCRLPFGSIDCLLLQLQHQIKYHVQLEIPEIAAYVSKTAIYLLQFLMVILQNTCIMDIGLLVGTVVGKSINVIVRS